MQSRRCSPTLLLPLAMPPVRPIRRCGVCSPGVMVPEEDGVIVILNNNTVGYENMIGLAATLAAQHFGGED